MRVNPWNLAVAGIASGWGFVSVIVAGIDLPGESLVFWRCLLAGATLPVLLVALGRLRLLVPRRRRGHLLGLGLLLALHWVLFFETIKRASVAVAILLVYTAPIFLAVLAPLILGERRSRVGLLALAVSGPGIALISLGADEGASADLVAIGTGLVAALTYALLIVWTKSVIVDVSPFTLTFCNYVIVSTALAPLLVGGGRVLPRPDEWPAVLVLGVLLTAVMGIFYVRTLREVTAQAAGLLSYLEPVSASLLAWMILDESLGWQVVVGGAAVLAGGALVVLKEGTEAHSPETAGV